MPGLPSFVRRVALPGTVVAITALAAAPSQATAPAGNDSPLHRAATASTTDPLVGTWDTGPTRLARVRAAAVAAGYTNAEVARVAKDLGLAGAKFTELKWRFYRQAGMPYVVATGWDPTKGGKPGDGDHGPYKLLAHHRIAITSADPAIHKYRNVFSWRISGKTLILHPVGVTAPTLTPAQLRLAPIYLYFQAPAPFKRIK